MLGDADVAAAAAVLAEPGRARIVFALADGRALPASVLAREAGVAASTASGHLARLVDAGMLDVEPQGRHRYYRVTRPEVVRALEALAEIAPPAPVRSLREGTRARMLRDARLCYDHVAGRLGVALFGALIDRGALSGGDGLYHPDTAVQDRLSAPGQDVDYRLTDDGVALFDDLGVDVAALAAGRRPLVRYCMDWSEQRHHLAGALGAELTARLLELRWIMRASSGRAARITDAGRAGLRDHFGIVMTAKAA
jgi:DNA-binding transcriptional ArsR family regulator